MTRAGRTTAGKKSEGVRGGTHERLCDSSLNPQLESRGGVRDMTLLNFGSSRNGLCPIQLRSPHTLIQLYILIYSPSSSSYPFSYAGCIMAVAHGGSREEKDEEEEWSRT